ncbi:MAG: prolyl oligopeptidase family serine peptidase, partial [Bacteroidota bacterium]
NFRGSTGYGKAFLNAGNNEWGQLMQDDLTWGVKHLVKEGIVDESRVAIMGGSYGGYATLAGLTFTPDVYAAGVSIVGPSNLLTLMESIPPYWESIRKMFYERMGNPETEEGKAQLVSQSPLFSANKIQVPLLVVQGANDPRVKKAESDQIVVAMRELGLGVEYICAPDEGHGFRRPVNSMAFLAAAEKFLAKHIGGRYQEDMPEDVANRLEEITVDIASVTMPEKVDENKLTAALPQPAKDLSERTDKYNITIAISGQEIKMDMTQEIKAEGDHWVITQSAKSMMGNMLDVATVEKGSLLPVKRSVEQGPAKINLEHSADKISGTMDMNGQSKAIEMEKDAALFGDCAALYETLAALPLEQDYTAVYSTFDMQMQKIKAFEMKVVGEEKVKVPAGEFDTYKIEITALEDGSMNTTVWVASSGEKAVIKSSATLPQMGGAKMTSELVE